MRPLGKLTAIIAKQIDKAGIAIEKAGLKNFDGVYIYTEDTTGNSPPVWLKLVPIPKIFYTINYQYGSGGQDDEDSLTLSRVSFDYSEEVLNTAVPMGANKIKYYIIDNKSYVVTSLQKMQFYWQITLKRVVTDQSTYTPPEGL